MLWIHQRQKASGGLIGSMTGGDQLAPTRKYPWFFVHLRAMPSGGFFFNPRGRTVGLSRGQGPTLPRTLVVGFDGKSVLVILGR